jgi:subtilisin family serine protease
VPPIGLVTLRPRPGLSRAAALARLRALPGVVSATPEHRFRIRDVPNDPALRTAETATGTAPGTAQEWWAAREGFTRAWSRTHGASALVGVIDTGIDGTHPELRTQIAASFDRDDDFGSGPARTDQDGHGTHVSSLACAGTDNGSGSPGPAGAAGSSSSRAT